MKSGLPVLSGALPLAPDHDFKGLGYPVRAMLLFAAALALAVVWLVLTVSRGVTWTLTVVIAVVALSLASWFTRRLTRARQQGAQVLAALGAATADIPVKLRTRMPVVLMTGDGLSALFDRAGDVRHAHVGDGAIWLRVDRAQDLPRLALAVRQWRDGRAPDGVVLSVVPAQHTGADILVQQLHLVRQAAADASRMLGRQLPGYVAVYQRLTAAPQDLATPQWYGVSTTSRIVDAARFEAVIRAAENEAQHAARDRTAAARAAALASIIGWTQRVVIGALSDRHHPAIPWSLFGAGWIDCGPASGPANPWARDVEMQTRVMRAPAPASALPWPLPQPLVQALPRRYWMSPRMAAFAHALALVASAAAVAFWASAKNNEALLARIGTDLGRYSMIPSAHDTAKRAALQTLVADRDQLDRYARAGIPLPLSFGMYRGAQLMPAVNEAIASYAPPPPPPAVVTLDSMSLFDSGHAQLKPGYTRAMVGALEMIKVHPDKRILVAGYTDNVGDPGSNLKLSTARAQAVRDWLIDASGIPATQFAIQGYGDTRPITSNETPDGRARNRRVEITLVPDALK
ncbi:OmpA family protein [Paraburkholderia phenoliruptrix]|uniref:OmpA family protein n=1 Tax=Paraburkholderia phenoliruptrix TaxID=252970 RepID=UPI003D99B042